MLIENYFAAVMTVKVLKFHFLYDCKNILIVTFSHNAYTCVYTFIGPLSWTTQVSQYQKGKPIWILLKQETVSGSGISWAICKCAPRSRQVTMQAPHHSVFYRPDALPAAEPTASKH